MKTLLLSLLAFSALLPAAPVNYAISFTNTSGPDTPISGGFTYDASTGVVSNLSVAFTDRTYAITGSTGAFLSAPGGDSSGLVCGAYRPSGDTAVFSLLSQSISACAVTGYYWARFTGNAGNTFVFDSLQGDRVGFTGFPTVGAGTQSSGAWTVSAVPEPASLSLLGAGLALLALCRRR